VASATAVCYGVDLAWIGMVLTDSPYRGRGFARSLMREALAFCDRRGVEWVKLDATDMGRPLYQSLGFYEQTSVERWLRPPQPYEGPAAPAGDIDFELDRRAFGTDRSRVVVRLARDGIASVPGTGYATGRPGSVAAYFGPCVSSDAGAVAALVGWHVAQHASAPIFWDLLPNNRVAVELAGTLGFTPLRRLTRMMKRGPGKSMPPLGVESEVYALAGFEFG
jgi:Acetyltransferase (GNAT) domain